MVEIKKDYTRKELIELCEKAVVHHTKWGNRDSYASQLVIRDIYCGLTGGLEFKIDQHATTDEIIWIEFTENDPNKLKIGKWLEVSDLDDYFNDCDPNHETEMFNSNGISFNSQYKGGYMPTQKRLDRVDGEDWY